MRCLLLAIPISVVACVPQHIAPKTGHPRAQSSSTPRPVVSPRASDAPPFARKDATHDLFFGTDVSDPYRYLETQGPESEQFIAAQTKATDAWFSRSASFANVKATITTLLTDEQAAYLEFQAAGSRWFAKKIVPGKRQPVLVSVPQTDASLTFVNNIKNVDRDSSPERLVVDPNAIDPSGETTIDFFVASHSGAKVAVSLSKKGTESGDVHIFDAITGAETGNVIRGVNGGTAGGSVAWLKNGLLYTRYPKPGERPKGDEDFFQQVYYREFGREFGREPNGADNADVYEIGKEFPRIAETELATNKIGWALASVQRGDSGEYEHFVRSPDGKWSKAASYEDHVSKAKLGADGYLYLLSLHKSPRGKLLRVRLGEPASHASQMIGEQNVTLDDFFPVPGGAYVVEGTGGPSRVRLFIGKRFSPIMTDGVFSVREAVLTEGRDLLIRTESFVTPSRVVRYHTSLGRNADTPYSSHTSINFRDVEVTRHICSSRDGTSVPLTLLSHRGDTPRKDTPALLTGYGGFGVTLAPKFQPLYRFFLDRGGIVAIANLRGGNEFGETWHEAGRLTQKQNVFDDFEACARFLIKSGYTSANKLGIWGRSNGGLLMGAAVTQHPELYRAVVAQVGIYDSLRNELTPNGRFNTVEYGTVANEADFKALYRYSPYHQVKDGNAYPAIFLTSGANDPRVAPFHTLKFAARLQSASSSGEPILMRIHNTGHGMGTPLNQRINEMAEVYTFLAEMLGM